ncbi:isopropylmalate isomerase [Sulfitobacter sabulilitoris]|nr:isopropylmalate isomerase [Sulfitobacter sabulilitoris]
MTRVFDLVFDLGDRARLRERFFGATRTVLARL